MIAVIEDSGPPFDLRQAPLPERPKSLEDAIPGGLGFLLIRSFASEIDYASKPGRNRLTLRSSPPGGWQVPTAAGQEGLHCRWTI